ncbi:MAG: hypothetical protein V4689_12390 [Verrucomicrobiota bacterium]
MKASGIFTCFFMTNHTSPPYNPRSQGVFHQTETTPDTPAACHEIQNHRLRRHSDVPVHASAEQSHRRQSGVLCAADSRPEKRDRLRVDTVWKSFRDIYLPIFQDDSGTGKFELDVSNSRATFTVSRYFTSNFAETSKQFKSIPGQLPDIPEFSVRVDGPHLGRPYSPGGDLILERRGLQCGPEIRFERRGGDKKGEAFTLTSLRFLDRVRHCRSWLS